MNDDSLIVWCAPDLSLDQVEELRKALLQRRADPDFNPLLNFHVSPVTVRRGDIVIGEEQNAENMGLLRAELDKAWEDPTHIAVVPFDLHTVEYPR